MWILPLLHWLGPVRCRRKNDEQGILPNCVAQSWAIVLVAHGVVRGHLIVHFAAL